MSYAEQTIGEIASVLPGATRLFRQHHMDFCCGGGRSLREEAERKGANLNTLISNLEALKANPSEDKSWKKAGAKELIAHILERYHLRLREQLPELIQLAGKVERVHAESLSVPAGLADHLMEMFQDLENHMQKEERILFPMLMRGEREMASSPISVMESEHVLHGKALEKMLTLVHQLRLPENACNSWRALYLGVAELRDDLMEHIHLENNILFKKPAHGSPGVCCGHCSD